MKPKKKTKQFPKAVKEEFKRIFQEGNLSEKDTREKMGITYRDYQALKRELFPNARRKDSHYRKQRERFLDFCQNPTYTIPDVCEALGISITTFHNWRRQLLPEGFRKGGLKYQEFVKLYELEVFSLARIAQMMGCHTGTVSRYKSRYQKETRPQSAVDSTLEKNEPGGLATTDQVPGSS